MTPARITDLDLEALRHIATGGTIRELARADGITQAGAAMRLHRVYRKLDVLNGTHAVYRAVSIGLLEPEAEVGTLLEQAHR